MIDIFCLSLLWNISLHIMKYNVFISYSSKDKAIADAVCHTIEELGIRCWIAPRDIHAGEEYGDVIADAVHKCKVFVLIFSEASSISKWVRSELNLAMDEQLYIIPFRVDGTPLSGSNKLILNKIHWIDAYPSYEKKLGELASNVLNIIKQSKENEIVTTNIPKTKTNKKIKKHIKLSAIVSVLLILVLFCGAYFIASRNDAIIHSFEYSKNGIIVNGSKCSSVQAESIAEILDNMVYVEGGSFTMGISDKERVYYVAQDKYSTTCINVELDDFYISKIELTQKQWNSIMGNQVQLSQIDDNFPMYNISWNDCMDFINKLSEITGLHFTLPSEAQWEYAARGGNNSAGYIYAGSDVIEDVGWVASFDNSIHKVGVMDGNELGMFDMTGNISEWCYDYFSEEYRSSNSKNPIGPKSGKLRIIRGGNVCTNIYNCKISTRQYAHPNYPATYTGMRLVIIP